MPRLASKNKPVAPRPLPTESDGRQLLTYMPDGLLGGTFTCTRCGARAWQPDLLDHTPNCAYRPPAMP